MSAKQLRKEAKRRARNKKRRADYNRRKNARGKREQIGGFHNVWYGGPQMSRLLAGAAMAAWLKGAA